jgi:hypothetical protein
MRAFFLLLLAANLAFFAWSRYYSDSESVSDPQPLGRQIFPEKIRILPAPEPSKVAATKPAVTTPASTSAGALCVEWGGFAVAEAPKAEQALAPLALGARLAQSRSQETAGWWVYIPPQVDRPSAQKKAAELKSLGIEDYFVIQEEGPLRWAISLGVFSSEEAAKNRLEALRAKKVRSAQTGEREAQVAKVWFQVRDADAGLQEKLRGLAAGFPGTELRSCK